MWRLPRPSVLSTSQLRKLREHVYRSEGMSITEQYFLGYFWDYLVRKLPLWLAPNLITCVGFSIALISSLLVILQDMGVEGKASCLSYGFCAVSMFIYQTLDGIDGKQARRTGSSNPLGEFFDHGCDAVMTFVYALVSCSSVALSEYPFLMAVLVFTLIQVNFTYHWQTYVCGVLHFKQFDTQEALLCQILGLFITAVFGPDFWSYEVPALGFPLKFVLMSFTVLTSALNISHAYSIILTKGVGKNGSTVADTSVVSPIFTPLAVLALSYIYHTFSPAPLLFSHPVLFLTAFCFPISKMVVHMMLAAMTKHPYPLFDHVMLGPLAIAANAYFGSPFPEYYIIIISSLFTVADICLMCVAVCRQMCDTFNVYCFSLSLSPSKATHAKNGAKT